MSKSPIFSPEEPCEHYSEETVKPSGVQGRMLASTRRCAICTLRSQGYKVLFPYKPKCGGCKTKCDFNAFGLIES